MSRLRPLVVGCGVFERVGHRAAPSLSAFVPGRISNQGSNCSIVEASCLSTAGLPSSFSFAGGGLLLQRAAVGHEVFQVGAVDGDGQVGVLCLVARDRRQASRCSSP